MPVIPKTDHCGEMMRDGGWFVSLSHFRPAGVGILQQSFGVTGKEKMSVLFCTSHHVKQYEVRDQAHWNIFEFQTAWNP